MHSGQKTWPEGLCAIFSDGRLCCFGSFESAGFRLEGLRRWFYLQEALLSEGLLGSGNGRAVEMADVAKGRSTEVNRLPSPGLSFSSPRNGRQFTIEVSGVCRFELNRIEPARAYATARETVRFTPSKMSTMLTPSTMWPRPATPEIAASIPWASSMPSTCGTPRTTSIAAVALRPM